MASIRRLLLFCGCSTFMALAALSWSGSVSQAGDVTLPPPQEDTRFDKKKVAVEADIKADTDRIVLRMGTMIRVLQYCQLDKSAEKLMLEEMYGLLSKLSKEQMTVVINRLEASARALQANDTSKSREERDKAYAHHRQIIETLMDMLARYDAVERLDEAAKRMEDFAEAQLKSFLQNADYWASVNNQPEPILDPVKKPVKKVPLRGEPPEFRADDQQDLKKRAEFVFTQLRNLGSKLPAADQERLQKLESAGRTKTVTQRMANAAAKLKDARQQERSNIPQWQAAGNLQWEAAGELLDLARGLRPSVEKLAALIEVRERLSGAVIEQETILGYTGGLKQMLDAVSDREITGPQVKEQADKQAKLEHETRDCCNILKPHAKDLATMIEPAEKDMRLAQDAVRTLAVAEAFQPEQRRSTPSARSWPSSMNRSPRSRRSGRSSRRSGKTTEGSPGNNQEGDQPQRHNQGSREGAPAAPWPQAR